MFSETKKILHPFYKPVRDFFVKHPALLSGYIIYAYFFITTMDFYRDFKKTHTVGFMSTVEKFDAVIDLLAGRDQMHGAYIVLSFRRFQQLYFLQ